MSDVIYRVPGFMSTKSVQYIEALTVAGWPEWAVDRLKHDLPIFESLSVVQEYDEARAGMVYEHDPAHEPFLKNLNHHIRTLSYAERIEDLQRKATRESKDSMAAHEMFLRLTGRGAEGEEGDSTGKSKKAANISFLVRKPKTEIQVTRGKPKQPAAG